jgi:acyl carrier protein
MEDHMTEQPEQGGGLAGERLLAEIAAMLREVCGEDDRWAAAITQATRLEADLRLDSIELAALGEALRRRYGGQMDLTAYVAGLDIDQIIGLTMADLAAYVAARYGTGAPTGTGG